MAGKERKFKVERRRERIRYGRATLTIECSASVLMTPLAEALAQWRRGNRTSEEVAWAFVRQQTVRHSPSFDWKNADLTVLLPRVIKAIEEPGLTAKTADELMLELERLEQRNQATLNASRELTQQWARTFPSKTMDKLLEQVQPDFSKAFSKITFNYDALIEEGLSLGALSVPAFDPDLTKGIKALAQGIDFSKMFEGSVVKLHGGLADEWASLAGAVTAAARDIQFPEVVEAVEATSEATKPAPDATALVEALQPMFVNLEKAIKSTKDSATRVIVLAVAATLIAMMIQVTLARFGIYVAPPEPQIQAPQPKPKPLKQKTNALSPDTSRSTGPRRAGR